MVECYIISRWIIRQAAVLRGLSCDRASPKAQIYVGLSLFELSYVFRRRRQLGFGGGEDLVCVEVNSMSGTGILGKVGLFKWRFLWSWCRDAYKKKKNQYYKSQTS